MNSALLYVRVSSKEQEREGFSLDAQEKLGEDYARKHELNIVKRWKVSESAWKEERTAFGEMLDYAKRHEEVRHIIFDVTDRMTRNDLDKIKIYTLIKYHDKKVHFSRSNKTMDKHSGSEDEFMLDIEVAVAKKMSNDISRKTKMGMLEKAEQGLYPSVAPLGYKNNKVTHLIDIDEEKAPYIRRAFNLIASGTYSLSMSAETLYKEGFRGIIGTRVTKAVLAYILNNPVYYGAFRWKGKFYLGSHEPLISKELFDKAQSMLQSKSRPYPSKKGFAFNNLITCGICSCKVLGEQKKKKYNYYHCTFSKGRHKGFEYLKEEELAELLGETLKPITIPEEIADWLIEALRESSKNDIEMQENRLKALNSQYEKLNARLSRLYDAKFDGEIEEDAFKAKETEYKNQLIELKSQINSIKIQDCTRRDNLFKSLELSKRLNFLYNQATYEEKAQLLKSVASNFSLHGKNVDITYKKPFDILVKGSLCTNWLPG